MRGKNINVDELNEFEIFEHFEYLGWKNLLDMGKNVYSKYIKIFFSNMKVSKHIVESLTIKS